MRKFPAPIHRAVAALTSFPGVGPKTALRYTFALLRQSQHQREQFAQAILGLAKISRCDRCFAYSEEPQCALCKDSSRHDRILCIVSESRDISTIEATGAFKGRYFVLGGTLNPIEGQTPETLNFEKLLDRLRDEPHIEELILAFSPDVHGETTMMYLSRQLKSAERKVTRLARGLPLGADLEYADEITLSDALTGRRNV
jgi:recombination protein RecR